MGKIKFSIVIPYEQNEITYAHTITYLKKVMSADYDVEIITPGAELERSKVLAELNEDMPQHIMLVETQNSASYHDLLNSSLQYCSGDYIIFLRGGDILNLHILEGVANILTENDISPKLINFRTTEVMEEFELSDYLPFDTSFAEYYDFPNPDEKKKVLCGLDLCESYHAFLYKRDFLLDSEQIFSSSEGEYEGGFSFPLMLLADSLLVVPEQGYIFFYSDLISDRHDVAARIINNQKSQLELYGLLKSNPHIFSEYAGFSGAHFLSRYFIHTIDLIRAGNIGDITLEQFQLMQLSCLKLVPDWIFNDFIYSGSKKKIQLLRILYKRFSSEKELYETLCADSKISVIITTYNRGYILGRGIQNILNQTYQNFELIVVNDNSTDDTEEVVKSFDDPRIRYIKNPENKGVSFARNLGIKEADCDHIIFQDDDDLSRLDKLEKLMKVMAYSDDNVGAVYHELNMYTDKTGSGKYDVSIIPDRAMADIRKKGYVYPALLPKNFFATPAILIKKNCLDKVGVFDEELTAYEDWELALRLVREYDVEFIKEPMYDYIRSNTGLISNKDPHHREKVLRSLYMIDLKYEEDRKSFGIQSNFRLVDEE